MLAVFAFAAEIGTQAKADRVRKIKIVNLATNSASQTPLLPDRDQMQFVARRLEATVDAPTRRRTGENHLAHVHAPSPTGTGQASMGIES